MRNSLITILFVICISSYSQKVGLVLSGGGAKGLTHIGVIKALEENNIPIDYITGTSIGAIVGGLYSLGYSPDEITQVFKSKSFFNWITGKVDEQNHYYFKDNYDIPVLLKLGFSLRDSVNSISYPVNLIDNSPMDFAFMKLFSAAGNISDQSFDDLFIPFRCVAADIYNKKTVVFSKGNLAKAVRASMAVPFLFRPVIIDSMLLFDGGIYNNFPNDIMVSDFNPDFVIGSQVARNSKRPTESDLFAQIENMITFDSKYDIDTSKGIMIRNLYDGIGLLQFEKIDYLINRGYESTLKLIDSIKRSVNTRVSAEDVKLKRLFFKSRIRELNFDSIIITGVNSRFHSYISKNLKNNKAFFSIDNLDKEYHKLLFDENIESLSPSAIFNPNTGFYTLKLNVKKAKEFKFFLGGQLSSNNLNQGYVGLQYNFFRNNSLLTLLDFQYGRFYSAASLKFRNFFTLKTPLRLTTQLNYNNWDYFALSNDFFFTDFKPLYFNQKEYNGFIDLGFPAYTNSVITFGCNVAYVQSLYYPEINFLQSDKLDKTINISGGVNLGIENNTQNFISYPYAGKKVIFSASYTYSSEELKPGNLSIFTSNTTKTHFYPQLKFSFDNYFKINKTLTVGFLLESVYNDNTNYINYTGTLFSAPSFSPTPHSKTLYLVNYRSNKYIAGGIKGIINLTDRVHFRAEGYFFTPYKEFNLVDKQLVNLSDNIFPRIAFIADATLVYHSIIGPLSFSANYYEREGTRMFYQLNFGYLLFNRSVLK